MTEATEEAVGKRAPLWLMGLTFSGWGIYAGVSIITIPQLLASRHVPESSIASIQAWVFSPGLWAFLLGPLLDVGLSRRTYGVVLLTGAALCLTTSFFVLDNLYLLGFILTAGFLASSLYVNAIGGWLAEIICNDQERAVGAWSAIGFNGSAGLFIVIGGEIVRGVPLAVAALLLGSMTLLPLAIFPWMKRPSAPLPWSVAGFKTLAIDLGALVRQPALLLALLFFLAPVGAFSLTNYLPTHADDFHASEAFASRVGGAAILIGSLLGPAIFGIIGRLLSIPAFYLAIGTVGSAVTMASCAVDSAPAAFAGILVVQNVFQNIGVAAQTAFELDTIGRNNPLSATAMSLMNAAIAAPLSYMLIVESWGYGWRGWQGSLIFDGSVAVSSGLLCFIVLGVVARRKTL